MISKLFKIFTLVNFSLLISLPILLFLIETTFFDLFYYQKSITHGYWIKDMPAEAFGERVTEQLRLSAFIENYKINNELSTLYFETKEFEGISDEIFTIVVVGDSYVWGQGVRNKQIFTHILEKKLNKIKPTRVISLGNSGDNVFDYYIKYFYAQKLYPEADLFIFGLVNNDLLLNENERYDATFMQMLANKCDTGLSVYDKNVLATQLVDTGITKKFPESINSVSLNHAEIVTMSLDKKTKNWCQFEKIVPFFPKDAIYVNFDAHRFNSWLADIGFSDIVKLMKNNSLDIVDAKGYNEKNLFLKNFNHLYYYGDYSVSKHDFHPSAYAHWQYANLLYNKIIDDYSFYFFP